MAKRWGFVLLVLCWGSLGAGVSLEDIAREYKLSLRYDWNLGYGELRHENTNRLCRVYFHMPYIVVEGRIYYFEEGVSWETNGKLMLSPSMESLVREFATTPQKVTPSSLSKSNEIQTNLLVTPLVPTRGGISNTTNQTLTNAKTSPLPSPLSPMTNRGEKETTSTQKPKDKTNQEPSSFPGRDLFRPIKTVILDPGHGGKDPGGIGKSGIKEKEVVLEVTQLLQEELEKMGYRVLLTRSLDRYVSLAERVELAYDRWNGGEGALFVSIHGNISLNPKVRGIEIYYLSDKASDAGASAVEIAENAGFSMDDVKHTESFYSVLNVLMREGVSRVSRSLAQEAKIALASVFSRVSVKSANFYVLRFSPLPAILWEIGYLSHPEEVKQLTSPSYQQQMARAMATGLDRFIRRYNTRRGNI
ncbi:MAG: N-acetylmuramoyl-L-alanine amidase [Brevinematales bacterium]|nr:N-acetylmuramoyl-L-alanine amidase [Brevinematales bacterium]